VSFDTEREAIVNAIQQALTKHRQEKAMIEKRVAGDQQRLRELDAVIAALEAIPAAPAPGPTGKSNSSPT
jgi:hypothetical protein